MRDVVTVNLRGMSVFDHVGLGKFVEGVYVDTSLHYFTHKTTFIQKLL